MAEQKDSVFSYYERVLPDVHRVLGGEVGVTLTDREKILVYIPAQELDLKAYPGTELKPGSGIYKAVHENRQVSVRVDKKLYGIPYLAMAVPVAGDNGEVIGSIAITQPLVVQEKLNEMAASLNQTTCTLAGITEEVSAQTEEILAGCQELVKVVRDSNERAGETDQVLGLVRSIAGQTNLLGLNAAIEAARVGDQGRGFGVVAGEIRKLAADSTESVNKIAATIKAVQAGSELTRGRIEQIAESIGQIATAMTEIANAAQQAGAMVRELDALSEKLNHSQ